MDLQPILDDFETTLGALEQVLKDEYQALTRLDGAEIEKATLVKQSLDAKLRGFAGELPDRPAIRASLDRLRTSAQVNQALLIHARACLRGAIETAGGGSSEPLSYARPLSLSAPVRINLRG